MNARIANQIPVLNNYDVSDLVPPTDDAINKQFSGLFVVYPRENGTLYVPSSTNPPAGGASTASTLGVSNWSSKW